MIHPYDIDYLDDAQDIMGDMLDFAINTCKINADKFIILFRNTSVANQFEKGNPKYIAGMNGCEVARDVMYRAGIPIDDDIEDIMYLEKSPEYWAGWALCYYQWATGYSFNEIFNAVPINKIIDMYYPYHEADITKFVEAMDYNMKSNHKQTMLKRLRAYAGLSQMMLAEKADVSIRQIQLFEQQKRDINKTSAETLEKLSKALNCKMEDLLEKN